MGSRTALDTIVTALANRESARGRLPEEIITYAARATKSAHVLLAGRLTTARVERYFSAVVRRRLARVGGGTPAAARLVAEAVVEDLIESGRAGADIVDELERGWRDRLPEEVIEEWRELLCA